MNHIHVMVLGLVITLAGCTTDADETCLTSTSSTTASTTSTNDPTVALEIATCATFPINPAQVIGGDLFCLAITAFETVEIRALSIDIQGASLTHDLLVGSASTVYFHDLKLEKILPDSSRQVLMGPIELPPLPAASRDSGIFSFTDTIILEPGIHSLRITGMHDRPEDAPNEFMTVTAHYYFAWINDGATPFNDGEIRDASGNPISLDRIFWMPDELLAPAYVIEPTLD